jgi:carboxyl-terminal processing protease
MKKLRLIFTLSLLITVSAGMLSYTMTEKYFEIAKNLDIFATMYREINTYYVDEVVPTKFMKEGIDAMLENLDPYTNYIPEDEIEDYRTHMTGQYGGIGAIIGTRDNKAIILMPYENFPAHKNGLMIGDEIVSVDGIDCKGKNTSDISKLLKGQAGTSVKITVRRYGKADTFDVVVTREKIKIDNVPYYGMIDKETGYIKLSEFTSNASKDVRNALEKLKEDGAKSIVFDLRDNPGGLLNEAVNISNIFIPKDKPIVSTKGKTSDWNKVYYATTMAVDTDIPVAVLTSSRSASASEIVSGVIQDYDRGVIVGQRSYGKGLVQATRPLSYNAQLKITTAKYYTPSGRCIQAIDYSHRNEDGSVGKIPDSLRHEFLTANKRVVYDGGGITPDIQVERKPQAPITASLVSKHLIFDYATLFVSSHKTIGEAREFNFTEQDYKVFVDWLKDKDYDYTTKVESTIAELEKAAKNEKYYDDAMKAQIESLRKAASHNKERDLQTFKNEIIELLETEIASRYYLQRGIIESSFDNDEDVLEALKVLKDSERYKKILSGK